MSTNLEAVRTLADSLGYTLIKKQEKTANLTLGKNRKEKGHTVRYNQLNWVFSKLGMNTRCVEGNVVHVRTVDGRTISFSLNKNGKAYCGVQRGANMFPHRSTIQVVSIAMI